ncbi:MAG: AraC family transcriptional regulator [Bacillota bacterium]
MQQFTDRQHMLSPDFEFFHYQDDPCMEVRYHNHNFYEIYFLLSGNVTYLIEGNAYKLKPGDILLINDTELHKPLIEPGRSYERIVIWINPVFLHEQSCPEMDLTAGFKSADCKKVLRLEAENLSYLRHLMGKLEKASIYGGYGDNILRKIHLTEILVHLHKALLQNRDASTSYEIVFNERIRAMIQYINGNLGADLSLERLSALFYLSKYHLLREFKKNAGYTLHQYILEKRLIMAKSFLKEGANVTEACLRCGFKNYSNFIRAFKKKFGVPPGKYLKAN